MRKGLASQLDMMHRILVDQKWTSCRHAVHFAWRGVDSGVERLLRKIPGPARSLACDAGELDNPASPLIRFVGIHVRLSEVKVSDYESVLFDVVFGSTTDDIARHWRNSCG